MDEVIGLRGARVALGADTSARLDLRIRRGRFLPFDSSARPTREFDLSGLLLLPGLINAHDHLEFNLFPRLGAGPWSSAREWAAAIYRPQDSPVREHRAIPRSVRLWWGALRNLLCGVTTVAHHNPWEPLFAHPDFPVRVVRKMGWAHSLDFSPDLALRYKQTPAAWPFVVHAAEGTGDEAQLELKRLIDLGVVNQRTALVHATGATPAQVEALRRAGASVVWCPSSNLFTLGQTLAAGCLRSLPYVSLGTDSALTAEGDMIDEMHVARQCSGMSPREIFPLVTANPAHALRLDAGEGAIREGGVADLVAVRDRGRSPADSLADLKPELALLRGRTALVSERLSRSQIPADRARMHRLHVEGRGTFLLRAPVSNLYAAAVRAIGPEVRLAGKRVWP